MRFQEVINTCADSLDSVDARVIISERIYGDGVNIAARVERRRLALK
jgi:hypothetical protein